MATSPDRQSNGGRPSAPGGGIGRMVSLPPAAPTAESHRIPEACHGPAGLAKHHEEVSVKAVLVPKELYEHIVEAGVTKAKWRLDKQIIMGLLAGFYIGFSFSFMMVIGGQIPEIQHGPNPGIYNLLLGSFGFPLGLFMICVVGADLFTSNCSYMITALHEGKISIYALIKSWTLSWFVNLAGSIIMAEIVYSAAIFEGRSDFVLYLANKKTHYTFTVCMMKALLANWLVNLAVWIANSAQDVTGKAIGIFLPISAFISIGGEHCIANQFLFTLAKLHGWDASVGTMIGRNLVPSTIGNAIGGAFFVGTLYSLSLGTLFDSTYDHIGRAYAFAIGKSPEEVMPYGPGNTWWHRFMQWLVSPHWLHRDVENPHGTRSAHQHHHQQHHQQQQHHHHLGAGVKNAITRIYRAHTENGTPVIVVHDNSLVDVDKTASLHHQGSSTTALVLAPVGGNGSGGDVAAAVAAAAGGATGSAPPYNSHIVTTNHVMPTRHHVIPAGAAAGQKLQMAKAESLRVSSEAALLHQPSSGSPLNPHLNGADSGKM